MRFLLLYIGMAGLVIGAWMLAPTVSLLAFLIISMLHFGAGDARHGIGWLRSVEIVAHGGLVIVGISQIHQPEVDVIFGYLTGADTAFIWQALDILTVVVGIAVAICIGLGWSCLLPSCLLLSCLLLAISVTCLCTDASMTVSRGGRCHRQGSYAARSAPQAR